MSFQSPKEIVQTLSESGVKKSQLTGAKILLLAFLAGAYIAFGGLLAIKIGAGVPSLKQTNPGLSFLLFGSVFPVGLMLVVIAGAELFTGNTAVLIPALHQKKIQWKDLFKNWSLSYIGNFIGSIFVAYFLVYQTNLFIGDPWLTACIKIAEVKVSQDFYVLVLKAIGCNWLVCLAVWLSTSSKETSGKVIGIWFPIMAFVAIGFEHSVANMFFIPLGIFYGADVSWLSFLSNNLLPVSIGNIIGGSLFVGIVYAYIYKES